MEINKVGLFATAIFALYSFTSGLAYAKGTSATNNESKYSVLEESYVMPAKQGLESFINCPKGFSKAGYNRGAAQKGEYHGYGGFYTTPTYKRPSNSSEDSWGEAQAVAESLVNL